MTLSSILCWPRPETVSSSEGGTDAFPSAEITPNVFSKFARASVLALAGLGIGVGASPSKGALIPDGANRQDYINNAQPLLAVNGGPAVTVEIAYLDGSTNITSGTMLNGDTLAGGAHTLFAPGGHDVSPDISKIKSITVFTGSNYLTNSGPAYTVNLPSLKVASGYDGTFNTLDLYAAKLDTAIPGLGSFTIGGAITGSTVNFVGNGFYTTPSMVSAGTTPPKDGQFMSWNGVVDSIPASGASSLYYKDTDYGFNNPPQGRPGYDANGDSSGPTLDLLSEKFDDSGKLISAEIVGIDDAQSGSGSAIGEDIFTDLGNPTAAQFLQSEIDDPITSTPEPTSAALVLGGLVGALSARFRKTS